MILHLSARTDRDEGMGEETSSPGKSVGKMRNSPNILN